MSQEANMNRLELGDMEGRVDAQGSRELELNYGRIDNALNGEGA